MKKTYYQLLHLMKVCLKSIITIILLSVFTASFGQITDPPSFDIEKERQEALKQGVHGEEIDAYVEAERENYYFTKRLEQNGGGARLTIPPLSLLRKSTIISCPGNFENGTVPPWTGFTAMNTAGIGSFTSNAVFFATGVAANRHTIMSAANYDSVVNTLPVVRFGGGSYSLKLGNKQNGKGAERVVQTVTVTGSCLSFWYALVFENPNHNYNDQPFFMFRLFDSSHNLIDSFVREASNSSFFSQHTGGVVYRDWTKYTVDLGCEYEGKTVTIEFTTADCRLGGHFGYAYIDDVCFGNCCCKTCEDLINLTDLYTQYDIIQYKGSTDSSCCYRFSLPLMVAQVFKCSPFGIKIYEESNPSIIYSSYQGTEPIDDGFVTDLNKLDFCINRSSFTTSKTLVVAFYDSKGNLICDSIKRTIEPCYSSSGCNCDNLFSNPSFAQVSTIKKDTSKHYSGVCCFTFNPFKDSSIIKCPYYGLRIYKDSLAWSPSYTYLDTINPTTPLGGVGAGTSTDTFKFCLNSYLFDNGPISLRIEYLDSTGKVICSKVEKVSCEPSCCEDIAYYIRKDTTETDPFKCCYRIEVWAFACNKTYTAELMRETDSGWVNVGNDTFSITRPIFFDVCANNSDTARYMVFIKDSSGKILCNKEVIQTCPNCCDLVSYTATYVPPSSPYLDRCCWDINVYPAASMECNVWNWGVYDSLHNVPPFYPPFMPPSSTYQGRHCTPYIFAPNPAPGTSITIKYCITRYLAVYDNTGELLCIKPFELCCYRTYTNNEGNPQGPMGIEIAPNPFDETFTLSMDVPQEMPVAINVVNSIGSVVFTKDYGIQPQGMFTKEINLAGQPAGIYTLSINNGLATVQIVKQ